MPRYSIRKNRIKAASIKGFSLSEDGSLITDPGDLFHVVFLREIDAAEDGSSWGRLFFKGSAADEMTFCVYVLCADHKDYLSEKAGEDIDSFLFGDGKAVDEKIAFFKNAGAKRFMGMTDILLYELSGRYLYIAIEAVGDGSASISDIVIDSRGDNFMNTFPEIYRERNSFFHRYLSVFSSIYNDFQRDIDSLHRVLDLDTCTEEQLIIYGGWMGLDLKGGFLETSILRQLVKEAYSLNRMKGSRKAIERILEIILQEKAIVIEHNLAKAWHKEEGDAELPAYYKTKGVYDVTILVKKHLSEELRHQILYILDQYKPLRTNITISQLDEVPLTDSSSYLGVNTRLPDEKEAVLDKDLSMDGITVLK